MCLLLFFACLSINPLMGGWHVLTELLMMLCIPALNGMPHGAIFAAACVCWCSSHYALARKMALLGPAARAHTSRCSRSPIVGSIQLWAGWAGVTDFCYGTCLKVGCVAVLVD